MKKVERMSVMVVSTVHVTKHDASLLHDRSFRMPEDQEEDPSELPTPFRVVSAEDEDGFWLFSGWSAGNPYYGGKKEEYLLQAEDEGYSDDLIAVLRLAQEQECSYVRFVRYGPVYDDLRTHDW